MLEDTSAYVCSFSPFHHLLHPPSLSRFITKFLGRTAYRATMRPFQGGETKQRLWDPDNRRDVTISCEGEKRASVQRVHGERSGAASLIGNSRVSFETRRSRPIFRRNFYSGSALRVIVFLRQSRDSLAKNDRRVRTYGVVRWDQLAQVTLINTRFRFPSSHGCPSCIYVITFTVQRRLPLLRLTNRAHSARSTISFCPLVFARVSQLRAV